MHDGRATPSDPTVNALDRLAPEPADRRTAAAMTRLFYEYSAVSVVAGLAMIGLRTGWVLLVSPSSPLLPWLLYSLALIGLRDWRRRRYLGLSEAERDAQWLLWRRRAVLHSLAVAVMWMWALWDDFRVDDLHAQMFCTMVACITCVGSINVMAPLPRAYWALAAPTLGLLAGLFAQVPGWTGVAAPLLVLVGLALSASMANRHALLLFKGHALRFEREELVARLEQTSQARSRFFAAASHDLRQPLHALGLLAERLREQLGGRAAGDTAEQIGQMVQALDSMVDGLLDVSRLDAEAVQAQPVPMPLGPLLERLSASFALMAEARQLQWRQRECRVWVRSDPLQLERVLRNLVDNALRYTARGGVLLGCRRRGDHVRVCVWDTGPGIAPQDQARVFDEFVQLHNPGRDRRLGLGLGLATVARLCRLLQHPLRLSSRVGRGSCFEVLLPVVPAPAVTVEPLSMRHVPAAVAPASAVFRSPLQGLQVALVEDDDAVRNSTVGLLRQWGCDVQAAADVDTLLAQMAACQAWRPAAIISDQLLAAGDGIEAIARLRRHCGQAVPALLLSGQSITQPAQNLAASAITPARKPLAAFSLRAWLGAQAAAAGSGRSAE